MSDFWLRPKTHGYGASPVGWKSWALILGAVRANLGLVAGLLLLPVMAGEGPGIAHFILFLVLDTQLLIGLLALVREKTCGEWRWC